MQKLIMAIFLAGAIATAYYVVECIDAANNLVQQAYSKTSLLEQVQQ